MKLRKDEHKPWYVNPRLRKEGMPVTRFFHAHPARNVDSAQTLAEAFKKAEDVTRHRFVELGNELIKKYPKATGCTIAILGDQIGVAFCSHKDMFSYERGRIIAFGRMEKAEFRVNIGGEIQAA